MDFDILASTGSRHQIEHAHWLAQGLAACGVQANVHHAVSMCTADYVACWGWRMGQMLAARGQRVLVMERGYIGDRFAWTSLGWGGLNGRAVMPAIADAARFDEHHGHLMQPWRQQGDYVLLIGQVPGDAALQGRSLSAWYLDSAQQLAAHYGLPVRFRAHPKASYGAYPKGLDTINGNLQDALANAQVVVTFNSNTAVESVLAGVPTLAMDEGSMAWDVTGHAPGSHYTGDRRLWANGLAWKQWLPREIMDGTALNYVLPLRAENGRE